MSSCVCLLVELFTTERSFVYKRVHIHVDAFKLKSSGRETSVNVWVVGDLQIKWLENRNAQNTRFLSGRGEK